MRRRLTIIGLLLVAGALAIGAVACDDDKKDTAAATATPGAADTPTPGGSAQSEVTATLTEYTITLNADSVPSGIVTFNATNGGTSTHEFVVIKTDLAADALPTAVDGSVDEEGAGIEVAGEAEDILAEQEATVELTLGAGDYVLICNVVDTDTAGNAVSHYAEGMYTAFTVTD